MMTLLLSLRLKLIYILNVYSRRAYLCGFLHFGRVVTMETEKEYSCVFF